MSSPRVDALVARLEKGRQKTRQTFNALTSEQWQRPVYTEPGVWRPRDLLAHFLSAELQLLPLCQDIAAGGRGAPEDFDIDGFNAAEQQRLADCSREELSNQLDAARQKTLDWIATLREEQLDLTGNHPALGEVTLETLILSIYGHQLFHIRDYLHLSENPQ